MEKEYNKFAASDLFEGMTSISAVIKSIRDGLSDRKIDKVMFDAKKSDKNKLICGIFFTALSLVVMFLLKLILAGGSGNDMEKGIFILCEAFVLLFKVCIDGTQVNIHADKRLIISPVGHQGRHDVIHRRDILEPTGVRAVSPFSFCHSALLLFVFVRNSRMGRKKQERLDFFFTML